MTRQADAESFDPFAKDFLYYGTVVLGWLATLGLLVLAVSVTPWFP